MKSLKPIGSILAVVGLVGILLTPNWIFRVLSAIFLVLGAILIYKGE